jgi:Ca-activated chloride channel family protein
MRRIAVLAILPVLWITVVAAPSAAQGLLLRPDRLPPTPPTPSRVLPMDLRTFEIDAQLRGEVVSATLEMTWYNPNPFDAEGIFVFPLPPGAAVSDFRFTMNGTLVRGEVLDEEKARTLYEEIVRRRKDPALLQYVGAGVFRASLFPLPARKDSRIVLRYEAALPAEAGMVGWRHPLGLCEDPSGSGFDLRIRVDVEQPAPIQTIYSPTHDIEIVSRDSRRSVVTFEGAGLRPEGDFRLYVSCGTDDIGMHLLTHRLPGEEGTFLLFLSPPDLPDEADARPKDLVFVLDTSGSMEGEKIEQAKEALRFVVRKLHPGDRFDLVTFSTEPRLLAPELLPADEASLERALAFIERTEAVGGTNIHDALLQALRLRSDDDRPCHVVFLTDGKPTVGERDPKKILDAVREANRSGARLFVFGVGVDVNTFLLDRLAEENRGSRDYVAAGEDIEVRVSSLYRKIAFPALEAPELVFEGIEVRGLAPRSIGDLFHGTRAVVAGRYVGSGEAEIVLRGRALGRERTVRHRAVFPARSSENPFVPRVWAMRRVGMLLDEIRLHGSDEELVAEVVRLGKRYGIVTPYTSSLVREDEPPVAGARRDREQLLRLGYLPGASGDERFVGATAVEESRLAKRLRDASGHEFRAGASDAGTTPAGRAAPGDEAERIRYRGEKTFVRIRGVWTDSEIDPAEVEKVVEIVAFSREYFERIREDPLLARYFSVGVPLLVRHAGTTYRVVAAD